MPVPGESCASVLNTRPPRHRPRVYHVRSAPSDAPTATTMLAPRLRCPLPASTPALSRAGITGTGRPPWLTRTHANRSHSRCWRSTGDYPHPTGGRRSQPRRSSAVQSVRGHRQHVRSSIHTFLPPVPFRRRKAPGVPTREVAPSGSIGGSRYTFVSCFCRELLLRLSPGLSRAASRFVFSSDRSRLPPRPAFLVAGRHTRFVTSSRRLHPSPTHTRE